MTKKNSMTKEVKPKQPPTPHKILYNIIFVYFVQHNNSLYSMKISPAGLGAAGVFGVGLGKTGFYNYFKNNTYM